MRAFILRRVELDRARARRRRAGRLEPLAPARCAIREFLTRNGHPYTYIDLDREPGVQELLDGFHVAMTDVPVLICRGKKVLRNPTNAEIADCLGLNDGRRPEPDPRPGRSSAQARRVSPRRCTARRKGSTCWCSKSSSPGGQAGSSSKIENYLGFPTGISGQELDGPRVHAGTEVRRPGARRARAPRGSPATGSRTRSRSSRACGSCARSVIIATGAEYRKLALPEPATVRGRRRVLRRDVHRGADVRRRRSGRGGRRQLRRARRPSSSRRRRQRVHVLVRSTASRRRCRGT